MLVSLTAFAGSTSADFSFNVLTSYDTSNMHWVTGMLDFTADSTSTPIKFLSTTVLPRFDVYYGDRDVRVLDMPNCCYGPTLDNVSVTDAPAQTTNVAEPSTLSFFGSAFLALMAARRGRNYRFGFALKTEFGERRIASGFSVNPVPALSLNGSRESPLL